jgi:hypothetical protein
MHSQISLSLPIISRLLTPPQPRSRRSSGGNSGSNTGSSTPAAAGGAGTALVDGLWELQQLLGR